ncbi:MAG: hypothetical protein WC756_14315 [Taibaiella sp.]|jgi:hypothetical protein
MKKQFNIPNLTFLTLMTIAVAGTKVNAASNIKATSLYPLPGSTVIYEHAFNPYINITTDRSAVGNTYSVRDQHGKIVRTGIVTSAKTFSIATDKLTTGIYSVHVAGNLLQQFIIK